MPSSVQSGTDILLSADVNGSLEVVAHQRDLQIVRQRGTIDASTKDDVDAVKIPGRRDSTVTLDSAWVPNNASYAALVDAYDSGANIEIRQVVAGSDFAYADALVTNISEQFPDQSPAVAQITLEITGGWTRV